MCVYIEISIYIYLYMHLGKLLFILVHSETFLYLYDQMNTYYFKCCVCVLVNESSKQWEICFASVLNVGLFAVILFIIDVYTVYIYIFCSVGIRKGAV